jgi:hypothetical protein
VKPAETRQPPRQEVPEQRLHGRALAAHRGVAVTTRAPPVLHVCVICAKPLTAERLYTCSDMCRNDRLDVPREQIDHLVDCALVHEQLDALVAGNPIGRARFTGTRSPKGRE